MDSSIVFKKTEKGIDEFNTRKYKIEPSLRRILILVDGSSNIGKILEKGKGLPDIEKCLEELESKGFIAPAEKSGSEGELKNKLITLVQQTLGKDADKVLEKIQAAPDSKEGLKAALNNCSKVVKLMIDEKKAEELIARCKEIFN